MIVSRWATRQAHQDPNMTPEQLIETANRLLNRQFISRGEPGGAGHFDRILRNTDYFEELFASFGFLFIFNDTWGYAGYISPSAFGNQRVPVQETIILLCLRLLYDEGAEKGYFVDGSADILVEEDEIQTVFSSISSRSMKPGELREILTNFKRHGLLSFDQAQPLHVSADVLIRPMITEVVDESFVSRLQTWGMQNAHPIAGEEVGASSEDNIDEIDAGAAS